MIKMTTRSKLKLPRALDIDDNEIIHKKKQQFLSVHVVTLANREESSNSSVLVTIHSNV